MSNLATITNNILADSGIDDINVVVTNGSYANPAWITALSWTKITDRPTTLAGYGITDAYTQTQVNNLLTAYVPYTGATTNVNLGVNSLTATGITVSKSAGVSTITFPAGVNDPAFISHTESTTNVGIMRFSVGDDNDTVDYFVFGNLNNPDAFRINANGTISIGTWQGSAIADAYISSATTWNAKQNAITLTTTGTSGVATFIGSTLNIPNYGSALSAYLPLAGGVMTGQIVLAAGTTSTDYTKGLRFPNDPYGGSGDTSGLRLFAETTTGFEAQVLELYVTNDGPGPSVDRINFAAPTNDLVTVNGNKIWNAGNLVSPQSAITLTTTGTSGAATFNGITLNIPQYQSVLTNPITGVGSTNRIPKFTGSTSIGDSLIFDNSTNISVGTSNNTRGVLTNDGQFYSYYAAEVNPRVIIDRDLLGGGLSGIGFTDRDGTLAVWGAAVGLSAARELGFFVSNGTSLVKYASINSSGTATFNGNVTGVSGFFSGNLQANGVLTIGNQSVAGNYVLQITPSTTNRVSMQAILAGVGISDIVMQPSGGSVGVGTFTSITGKLTVLGTQAEIHVKNDTTNTLTLGGWDGTRQYIKSINLGVALTPLTLQASSFTFDTGGATFVGNVNVNNTITATQSTAETAAIVATSGWSGTVNNPIITFGRLALAVAGAIGYDDPNTGLYIGTTTNHRFAIRTNNTDRITIANTGESTFNNNVTVNGRGIFGTTTPTEIGNASDTPLGAGVNYGIFHNSGIGLGIASGAGGSTQGIAFWNHNGTSFFRSMIITGVTGNVGIGNVAPLTKLTVNNAVSGAILPYINGTGLSYNNEGISVAGSNSNNTNIGNGLTLYNNVASVNAYAPVIAFSSMTVNGAYNSTYAFITGQYQGAGGDNNWAVGSIIFGTANSYGAQERMRLNRVGFLGIGSNDPTAQLHVKDGSYNRYTIRVESAAANNANGYGGIGFSGEEANTKGAILFQGLASNSYSRGNMLFCLNNAQDQSNAAPSDAILTLFTATRNATFVGSVTATAFFESSDSRIKTLLDNKVDYTLASNVGARYYKKNGVEELGYFAQDFEGILPSAVQKDENGFLNLSYTQVHTAKIASLEARVKELEQQLKQK